MRSQRATNANRPCPMFDLSCSSRPSRVVRSSSDCGLGRGGSLAGAFLQSDESVSVHTRELFFGAIGPDNVDAVDPSDGTEAEVRPRVIAAKITLSRVHPGCSRSAARVYRHFGAVGIATAE